MVIIVIESLFFQQKSLISFSIADNLWWIKSIYTEDFKIFYGIAILSQAKLYWLNGLSSAL